jgi:RNA polymerase sigma-70 factor (ECF subfamily)
MDDQLILEKIRNGDKKQLSAIYDNYRMEFIGWITHNYRCSEEEAQEIFQVAIVTFYENVVNKKLERLDCSIKTYLFAIGKYKWMERSKKSNKFQYGLENNLVNIAETDDYDEEKEQKLQQVESCLGQLGEPAKTILELYYYHGMSMEEIAKKLNYKNADTAKNLKYKSLIKLKKIFQNQGTLFNSSKA